MARKRRPPRSPRAAAAALRDAGRPRAAAEVYRRAMKRGWNPNDADTELRILYLFSSPPPDEIA